MVGGDTVRVGPEGGREGADPEAGRGKEKRREESGTGRQIDEKRYEKWKNNASEGPNEEDEGR